MSPEFLLLHVCAHLACNHAFSFSLRALCDIAEIVRVHPALDWAAVVEHGSRHYWKRGVGAALRLARDQLGVPVPAPALAALGGDTLDPALLAEALAQVLSATSLPRGARYRTQPARTLRRSESARESPPALAPDIPAA